MPFVRQAVASLINQPFDDYELIVQDAVSDDGTAEFLRSLSIPNVSVVSEPDEGLGDAYNRAFARCDGKILGTLDSDNLITPDALRTVDTLFRDHPAAAAIYGGVSMIDADGTEVGLFAPAPFNRPALMRCELVPPFSTSYFNRQQCGSELRGDASLTTCQDFDLWLRISTREILRTTNILGATRISYKSMSRNPENYEHFCAEKIRALENYISANSELTPQRDAAVSGIYCWAAETILEIEGPGQRFESFAERAAAVSATSERLQRVRQRAHENATS